MNKITALHFSFHKIFGFKTFLIFCLSCFKIVTTQAQTYTPPKNIGSSQDIFVSKLANPIIIPPIAYNITGGGSYCTGETGVAVGLANSQSGVTYQLKKDNVDVGTAVNGTGIAISFGNQTAVGNYTVVATNTLDGSTATMTGSATITFNPYCPLTSLTSGCYAADGTFNYSGQLVNGKPSYESSTPSCIYWTGSRWELLEGYTIAQYLITAQVFPHAINMTQTFLAPCSGWIFLGASTFTTDPCSNIEFIGGCSAFCTTPIVYNITSSGTYCTGVTIGLSNSQSGVTYQLKKDNVDVGTAVNGTGSAISFGSQTVAGIYTVVAKNGDCFATMAGNRTIQSTTCLTGILSGNHTICKGNSAAISVAVENGVAPFTLVFFDGTTNTSITNYTSGASIVVTPSVATVYTLVSITDTNGQQGSVSGTAVIAIDNTPVGFNVTTIPNDVTVTCDNIPTPASVSGINNCMTVTMSETSTKGTDNTQCSFYNYKITRTWTVTDKFGNTATAKQVISVGSTVAPIISPLPSVTVTESEIPPTVPTANITTGTTCMALGQITFVDSKINLPLQSCYTYYYDLTRTWKVTDVCGNFSTATQNMIVRGIKLTCPSDKTVNTNSDGTINYDCGTVLFAALGFTPAFLDSCQLSILRYELSGATTSFGTGSIAGVTVQKGITQAKYKLTHSGTENCTFNVTVNDIELPKLMLNTSNTAIVIDDCSFDNAQFDNYKPTASDNCTAMPTLSVLSDVSADISGCATKTADLKYTKKVTRTWKATDDSGNTTTALQTFYLRDKTAPTAIYKTTIVAIGNTNINYSTSQLNNGSTDNCTSSNLLTYKGCIGVGCTNYTSNLTLKKSLIPSPFTQTDLVVNVQVRDACGNTSVKATKITLKKAGTLGNTKQNDTYNNDISDTEANIPTEASEVPTLQGEMKCYPTPFSEDLNIQYNLTKPHENVTLKVYDNQGRLLKTMEQAEQLTGFYQIRWNLSDLKAGMYHICLELDGKCTKMERVIMMK